MLHQTENYEGHKQQKSNHLGYFLLYMLKRLLIECRKDKSKVITQASQKGSHQYSEPIKTPSYYMKLTKSAGKRVRTSRDWFWFLLLIGQKNLCEFF